MLRSQDAYSRPVQFTYKGESVFNTNCGGLVTILTSLLLLVYSAQQILFIFLAPDYNETVQTTYIDFTENTEVLEL